MKKVLLNIFLVGLSLVLISCQSRQCSHLESPVVAEELGARLYTFCVGNSKYVMNPEEGALLLSWDIKRGDGSNRSVIYAGENVVRGNIEHILSGAPIFFPFSGMSFAEGKPNQWKSVSGEVLPMRKFGFADNGRYKIVSVTSDEILLKFVQSDSSKKSYPYKYDFYVQYKFGAKSYKLNLILDNYENFALPWGVGYHPFFTVPWQNGDSHADYKYQVDCSDAYYVDSNKGKFIPTSFDDKSFANQTYLGGKVHTGLKSGTVKICSKRVEDNITIIINNGELKPQFALVTYGISNKTPFWAVEPWMTPPFAAGRDTPVVSPKSRGIFSVDVICNF